MSTVQEIRNRNIDIGENPGIFFVLAIVLYACLYGTVYGISYYSHMNSRTAVALVSIFALFPIGMVILLGLFANLYISNRIGLLVFLVAMLSLPIYFGVAHGIATAKRDLSRMYGRSQ